MEPVAKKQYTLLLIFDRDAILLGRKKIRMGAGYWNGPGGHVEINEEPFDAAIRECEEEFGVTPLHVELAGINHFIGPFLDFIMEVMVYRATDYDGELAESDEMKDFTWFKTDKLPYDEMWGDDHYWIPFFISKQPWFATFELSESGRVIKHAVNPDNIHH